MKVLLDENFPISLYHRLRSSGIDAEHIIILGQRGLQDAEVRKRLAQEELLFLTQDTEFEDMPIDYRATVMISRVRQSLPIRQRVDIWSRAIEGFMARRPAGQLFDLLETGEIVPWEVRESE